MFHARPRRSVSSGFISRSQLVLRPPVNRRSNISTAEVNWADKHTWARLRFKTCRRGKQRETNHNMRSHNWTAGADADQPYEICNNISWFAESPLRRGSGPGCLLVEVRGAGRPGWYGSRKVQSCFKCILFRVDCLRRSHLTSALPE